MERQGGATGRAGEAGEAEKPAEHAAEPKRTHPLSQKLTRPMVAKRLGMTIRSVERLQAGGVLRGELSTARGVKVWVFDPNEVTALMIARSPSPKTLGDVAAYAFQLFEASKPLSEIVVQLRQPPQVIRELYSEWLKGLEEGEAEREHERQHAAARAAAKHAAKDDARSLADFEKQIAPNGRKKTR